LKIIEALKKTKDLLRKAEDIRKKIADNCADLEIETPAYGTAEQQTKQISEWLQAHSDILKEIEKLRLSIQRTNLVNEIPVEVTDGKHVVKSIAAWIHRRKDLAKFEANAWRNLTNKGLSARNYQPDIKVEEFKVANVRKFFNQQERDQKVEDYTSEPSRIDAALEIANATTDLIE
jgi:hypothetical protein